MSAMVIDDAAAGPVGAAAAAPMEAQPPAPPAASAGAAGGSSGSSALPSSVPASRPTKVYKTSEKETEEERRRRHQEKKRKVDEHRSEILRRMNAETARQKLHKQDTNFSCPVIFDNSLPAPPVDARLMNYPFDDDFMFSYDLLQGVSSEQGSLHRLHSEPGLRVPIDLVDPRKMFGLPPSQRPPMNPIDAKIVSEEYSKPVAAKSKGEIITAEPLVDWMFRGSFMHLDLYDSVYKHADPQKLEEMRKQQRKKEALARVGGGAAGSRKQRIEASFKAVAGDQPLVHPTNKSLQPRRVWDVLPATHLWSLNHVLVAFDADPDPIAPGLGVSSSSSSTASSSSSSSSSSSASSSAAAAKRARLEAAVIRTMQGAAAAATSTIAQDSSVSVQYLLPAPSSSSSSSADDGDGADKNAVLKGVRNYHMTVEKADISKGDEQYALLWDDASMAVYLAPIATRAALTKIATDEGGPSSSSSSAGMQSIRVKSREPLPEEVDNGVEASATFVDAETAKEWKNEVQKNRERRRKELQEARKQAKLLAEEQKAAAAKAAAAAAAARLLENGKRARQDDDSELENEEEEEEEKSSSSGDSESGSSSDSGGDDDGDAKVKEPSSSSSSAAAPTADEQVSVDAAATATAAGTAPAPAPSKDGGEL